MAQAPSKIDFGAAVPDGAAGTDQVKDKAQARGAQIDTQVKEGKAPLEVPAAQAGLVHQQQQNQYAAPEQWRAESKDFRATKPYLIYDIALPNYASALQTKPTPGDDKELVMLAAKIQDAEGSVREGDEKRFENVDYALEHIQQQFKKDFLSNGGQFSDKARAEIREFLGRRMANYRRAYVRTKEDFSDRIKAANELGPVKSKPEVVLGRDLEEPFRPIIEDYTARQKIATEIRAKRDKEAGGTTSLDEGPPPGTRIGGEPVKGWRLSPDAEANAILQFQKTRDPAAYAAAVADAAVDAEFIKPEEREALIKATVPGAQAWMAKTIKTDADWAKMPKGLDYSQVDKKARDDLTLGGAALHALPNLPESVGQAITSTGGLALDAANSVAQLKPVGGVKSLTDLGGDIFGVGGQGGEAKAALDDLKGRYGGWSNLKNTLATDPFGLGLDVAGGAGLAMKVPAVASRLGGVASRVGSMIPQGLTDFGRAAVRNVVEAPGNAVRGIGGVLNGVPGEATQRAGAIGRERGRSGVATPAYEAAVGDLRGRGDPTEVIDAARAAVAQMRQDASAAYRSGMVDVSRDATTLDFAPVDQRLADLHRSAYHHGTVKNPRAAQVWQEARDVVEEWKAGDPATHHTPEGFDAMKQRLGDLVETYTTSGDRAAARIARGVYADVRQSIANQVPSYARTMREYEHAADLTRELERTFSLGDQAGVDTTLRKLQSVTRNNANTNYGYRTRLAELMDQYQPGILDRLSMQSLSSTRPRGLQGVAASSSALGSIPTMIAGHMGGLPGGMIPGAAMLAATPLTIPRVGGEIALGAGRLAGEAERLGGAAVNSRLGRGLTYLPRNYPVGSTIATQLSSGVEGLGNSPEEPDTGVPPILLTPEGQGLIRAASGAEPEEPQPFAYGGAVRRLARRYACGGPVRRHG